ncbi:hypothetical protein RI138_20080 [Streptomyces sp. C11-1]|uniref:Uncharacterized protein n=1 Tax=Streptomyces durocortorensis TaxID=2811104 RepID=A0ABY9VZG4_9ACTN|nr:hypothetical protein [Streptomyces durocortorensis]WNF28935.1 hypothetical protein RI138_20080 [Streptomyces durocortorensis]
MTGLTKRERTEIAAVRAVAVLVYALALLCAMLEGPRLLLYFLPALLGSLIAVWCVRQGVLAAVRGRAVGDNRPSDYGAGGRRP